MSDKETPVYAVPVEPEDNTRDATRIVIPQTTIVASAVNPPIITDLMKKTYQYGHTLRLFAGIDIVFNILYCLSDPYWFFPLLCSISGYYGAKEFKKNYVIFYFVYEIINLLGKCYVFVNVKLSVYQTVMIILSSIINIWVIEITSRFINMIRKLDSSQIDILKRLGYVPRIVYY